MSETFSSISLSKDSILEDMTAAVREDALKRQDQSITNEVIDKGTTILGTYTVLSDAITGGMGSVWRVRHNGWNAELAMKRPKPRSCRRTCPR